MTREPMWRRYRDLLRPRPADDVTDEVSFHLEMREEEARRLGFAPEDAAAAARERFGDVPGVVDELTRIDRAREHRRARAEWFAELWHDARFALRSLKRAPTFAATAVATVAIAIGANTAIFSVVEAMLLRPLAYARPDELVWVWGWAGGEYLGLKARTRSFADIAAYRPRSVSFDDGVEAERVDGVAVTANLFRLLGRAPAVGTDFSADASEPGHGDAVLLSDGLWQRRFGGDRNVVGKRVLIDGTPRTIVGVMPADVRFPYGDEQFWLPAVIDPRDQIATWAAGGYRLVARLRAGVSLAEARTEIRRVAPTMRHDNPVWDPGPKYGLDADVQPFHDAQVAATRPALLLLAACVLGVLVIACVNVANLLLARATARERELSIRAALGGGRARLVRQLLTESLVLSLAGAVLGVVLASAGVRWIVSNLPASVPRTAAIGVNATVLAFTALLSLVVGIAFGLLPAFRATTQRSGAGAVLGVRSASRGMSHARLSGLLVVSEIALAALLAIGAQLLVRSFIELRNVDPGFRPEHLLSARVSPPQGSYQDSAKATALYTQVLARISTLPGVVNAAATTFLPLTRGMNAIALRIQGQYEDVKHGLPMADHFQTVTSTYLATMGIRVLRGRGFTEDDALGQPPVALVSASMAKKFWPNEDAIGKHVGYPYPSEWLTVVGVVPDTKKDSLKDTSDVALYVPFRQRRELIRLGVAPMSLVVRTTGDPAALGAEIRNVVAAIDRSVPVSDVRTMDAVVARSLSKMRFTTALVSAFALTALLLGAVGVFGVMSYVVSQRTQEMGIRVALGATGRDVLALVLGRGAMLAMAGAALGVVAALGAVRPLRSLLYGISARDPLTFATVPLLFVVVALVASYGPARRATRADPVEVLRSD